MITPRTATPSVQSLFASQPELVSPSKGKKPLSGGATDDAFFAGKRASSVLTEKAKERGLEKKNAGGGEDDSFGAQLEKAVNRKSRSERDRRSDERSDADDAGDSAQAVRNRNERGSDKASERAESKVSDAADRADGTNEREANDEKSITGKADALSAESAAKAVIVQDSPTPIRVDDLDGLNESAQTEGEEATALGGFAKVLNAAGSTDKGLINGSASYANEAAQSADGGFEVDGSALKAVKAGDEGVLTAEVRGEIRANDDSSSLGVARRNQDGAVVVQGANASASEVAAYGAARANGVTQLENESGSVEKLLDQRAEIVSRTSRLAVLKAQPLTIDSLNELLVTIDPSLASQILRPTSLNGVPRERVSLDTNNGSASGRTDQGEKSLLVESEATQKTRDIDGFFDSRQSVTSDRATRRDATVGSDLASFNDREFARNLKAETPAKVANEQRRDDLAREVNASEAGKAQGPSSGGGALNVLNVAGATIGTLSDSLRGEAKTAMTPDSATKSQTINASSTTLGNANGSATNQGSRDEQGSSQLQQGMGTNSLTDDADADRAMNAAVASQLTRGVSTALRQRVGSMVMKLQPESLGQVRVNIDFASTTLNVRFDTATAQASQAIQSAMNELKSSLVSRGYDLGEARVTIDPTLTATSRASDAAALRSTAETALLSASARSSDTSKVTTSRDSLRQTKQAGARESTREDVREADADESLTVNAHGEVVQTKLSAVG